MSLSYRGFGILKDCFTEKELQALRNELTVSPKQTGQISNGSQVQIKLYQESSKKLYLPKYFGLQRFGLSDVSMKDIDHGTDINVEFTGKLRTEQLAPVESFLNAANDKSKLGGIINLSCGAGKTVIGLYIIAKLHKKTLIVVHKEFLLDQWKDRIQSFLPGAKIGLIKGKVIDVQDKDIVIASLQSLSMKDYDQHVFKGIGLVIVDEVHRTGTEVFSQALRKIQTIYTLGLSATIVRKDGMSKVFQWYLGDVLYKFKRTCDNVLVQILDFQSDDVSYYKEEELSNGKPNISRMINNICACQERTRMIADNIIALFHRQHAYIKDVGTHRRKVLVLSDRKAHLADIASFMPNNISFGYYIGNMKPSDLSTSETKDVILATYSFASEGFDAKDLDTLVLASPKTEIEQSVGRILRQKPEDRINHPVLIDILDDFSVFTRQAKKRYTYYKKMKFTIIPNSNDCDEEPVETPQQVFPFVRT